LRIKRIPPTLTHIFFLFFYSALAALAVALRSATLSSLLKKPVASKNHHINMGKPMLYDHKIIVNTTLTLDTTVHMHLNS
jgi:hypothetical protein